VKYIPNLKHLDSIIRRTDLRACKVPPEPRIVAQCHFYWKAPVHKETEIEHGTDVLATTKKDK